MKKSEKLEVEEFVKEYCELEIRPLRTQYQSDISKEVNNYIEEAKAYSKKETDEKFVEFGKALAEQKKLLADHIDSAKSKD